MSEGRYSFITVEENRERPTVRAPVYKPSEKDLQDKLAEIDQQIAGLQRRRGRIQETLDEIREEHESRENAQGRACGSCLAWKAAAHCEECSG